MNPAEAKNQQAPIPCVFSGARSLKKPAASLKRPAAMRRPACRNPLTLFCSGHISVPASVEVFREKVRELVGPSVPGQWITLAMQSQGHGTLQDKFHCSTCPNSCKFHGVAHYDNLTGEFKVWCTSTDLQLGKYNSPMEKHYPEHGYQ